MAYRKKPVALFEHGTRIYAPSASEDCFRVVSTDAVTGERVYAKSSTEERARGKAREFERALSAAVPAHVRRANAPRTVEGLANAYVEDHLSELSLRYREKHEHLLRRWILPQLAQHTVTEWNSDDSARVLAKARQAGMSDATVQDIGSAMRGLVTHARRLRWLTAENEDPLWMVRYSKRSTNQGVAALHVPRASLPTDEQCRSLLDALNALGYSRWSIAMDLTHRSGLRWGELTALTPADIEFEPARVVHVRRAVERGSSGPASIKAPKNGKVRTTIFPNSLADGLSEVAEETRRAAGDDGLLFPGARGGIMRRSNFQSIWVRAADRAGWPMDRPLAQGSGYGTKGRGWKWTGSARWSPHDLRHVAACWMLFDVGLDPAIVADKLGHADPAFTIKRYVGVRGDANETAHRLTDRW